MTNNRNRDLKIIGDNTASGGRYNDAKIVGNGIIKGDLECVTFKSVGDSRLEGSLKAGTVKVTGSIHVEGMTTADDIRVTGDLSIDGDFRAGHCRLRGGISAKKGIKANDLSLMGYVTVKDNCESESFKADGQIKIDGLLNAEEITISAYGQSKVAEMGGDRILVRKGSGIGKMLKYLFATSGFGGAALRCDLIEGDDIRLSHTKAKVVRGKNVIIDGGCDIDLVEYEESLRVSHGSSVKDKNKTGS